jgi:hypothetical protein
VNNDFQPATMPNMARAYNSTRISITLPDSVARKLSERSFKEGRSISNLAAFLIERSLED